MSKSSEHIAAQAERLDKAAENLILVCEDIYNVFSDGDTVTEIVTLALHDRAVKLHKDVQALRDAMEQG